MKIGNAVYLTVGVIAGAAASYFYCKKHFEKIAQEEIDSVKEYYKHAKVKETARNDIQQKEENSGNSPIAESVESIDYSDYAARKIGEKLRENVEKGRDEKMVEHEHPTDEETIPYIIDDKTVGSVSFYARATLLFYLGNEVLVDEESDEPVDDIEGTIGLDNLEILKSIPETSIYVRNVGYGIDYEVIKINGDWM